MNPDALQTLDALVRKGIMALPRRGLEIGGLLLGSDGADLEVDAVHPLTIEYRFGPSFELSDSDIEDIRQTIGRLRQQSAPGIIGHFRSYTKGELEITTADRTIAELIGAPQSLMLLIRGSVTSPSLARLYRNSGEECVELLAFPLAPVIAGIPAISPVETLPEQIASRATDHEIARNQPGRSAAVRRDSWARGLRWKALSLAGVLACALALVLYLASHRPARTSRDSAKHIGLSVRNAEGQITVSWDRSRLTARNGISGVLTIQDGGNQRQVQLTSSQLESETIVYTPQTATVEFRLEIYRDHRRDIDERVMVVGGQAQAVPQKPAQDQTAAARDADRPIEEEIPRKAKPSPRPLPPPRDRKNRKTRAASKSSTPPRAKAPPVKLAKVIPGTFPAPKRLPEPAPETLPAPPVAQPAPIPPHSPDSSTISALVHSSGVALPAISYVAPIPVRKAAPLVPVNLRSFIQDSISIEVKVLIDAQGQVITATPVDMSSPIRKLLSPSAVQAAALWRFHPARRNGQPVGSETILRFDFEPRIR